MQLAAQSFCSNNAGKPVGYDSRLETIGDHISFTAICASCQPNNAFTVILDENECNDSMSQIINDCNGACKSFYP